MNYKYVDIVFQEVPDEVSLAISISGCPNRCIGCHSVELRDPSGTPLTLDAIIAEVGDRSDSITCILFMGGDSDQKEVLRLAELTKIEYPHLKIAWYSGSNSIPPEAVSILDYIKIGPYNKDAGPLKSKTTNQHMYKIDQDC